MKQKESQIQQAISNYLRYKGFYCQRLNSGMIRTETGGMVKLAAKGTPDLMCFKSDNGDDGTGYPCGGVDLYFIEVKVPGKKPTLQQTMLMAELESFGAKCLVATSIEDLQKAGL